MGCMALPHVQHEILAGCAELRPHHGRLLSQPLSTLGDCVLTFCVPCLGPAPSPVWPSPSHRQFTSSPGFRNPCLGTHANTSCPPMKPVLGSLEGHPQGGLLRNNPLGLAHQFQADRGWCQRSPPGLHPGPHWPQLAPPRGSVTIHVSSKNPSFLPPHASTPWGGAAVHPGKATLASGHWSLGSPSKSRARNGFLLAIAMPAGSSSLLDPESSLCNSLECKHSPCSCSALSACSLCPLVPPQ